LGGLQLKVFVCMVFLSSSKHVIAWSAQGHALVLREAYTILTPEKKTAFDALAAVLPNSISMRDVSERTQRACSDSKALCSFAIWPDRIRDVPLSELFTRAGEAVPPQLVDFSATGETTARWHYTNAFYSTEVKAFTGACAHRNKGLLAQTLAQLFYAYGESKRDKQKAIILSLLLHMLADAHQPLHTVSAHTKTCKHDYGGNGVCVTTTPKRCKKNLHQLWDSGGELFDKSMKWDAAKLYLNSTQIAHIEPLVAQWLRESQAFAVDVYTKPKGYSDRAYLEKVRRISEQRIVYSIARTANMLESLLELKE